MAHKNKVQKREVLMNENRRRGRIKARKQVCENAEAKE